MDGIAPCMTGMSMIYSNCSPLRILIEGKKSRVQRFFSEGQREVWFMMIRTCKECGFIFGAWPHMKDTIPKMFNIWKIFLCTKRSRRLLGGDGHSICTDSESSGWGQFGRHLARGQGESCVQEEYQVISYFVTAVSFSSTASSMKVFRLCSWVMA